VIESVSRSSNPAEIYAERVRGRKILLENPAKTSRARQQSEDQRSKRKEAKKKRAKNKLLMKRRDAKLNGIWELEKGQARYVYLKSSLRLLNKGVSLQIRIVHTAASFMDGLHV
jgi:ribonuclease P protein subunit POP4